MTPRRRITPEGSPEPPNRGPGDDRCTERGDAAGRADGYVAKRPAVRVPERNIVR